MNDTTPIFLYESAPRLTGAEPTAFRSFDTATESSERGHSSLDELKKRMFCEALEANTESHSLRQLQLAAERAAAVAAATPFPLLMFPCLFEEMRQDMAARFACA